MVEVDADDTDNKKALDGIETGKVERVEGLGLGFRVYVTTRRRHAALVNPIGFGLKLKGLGFSFKGLRKHQEATRGVGDARVVTQHRRVVVQNRMRAQTCRDSSMSISVK